MDVPIEEADSYATQYVLDFQGPEQHLCRTKRDAIRKARMLQRAGGLHWQAARVIPLTVRMHAGVVIAIDEEADELEVELGQGSYVV